MLFRDILMAAATQTSGGSAPPPPQASWPALIGAEMMVNGDCSSGTGWGLDPGFAIAAGKMTVTAADEGFEARNTGIAWPALIEGATYRCAVTVDSASAGGVFWLLGETAGTTRTAAGTYSQDIAFSGFEFDGSFRASATPTTMTLDSFSVKSVGLNGVSGDWAFTGDAAFDPSGVVFGENPADTAALVGSAKTAFDVAVSSSTACTVTITPQSGSPLSGTLAVALKGGTAVNFVFDGSGADVAHTVTSGTGSGFSMASVSGQEAVGVLARVQIELA